MKNVSSPGCFCSYFVLDIISPLLPLKTEDSRYTNSWYILSLFTCFPVTDIFQQLNHYHCNKNQSCGIFFQHTVSYYVSSCSHYWLVAPSLRIWLIVSYLHLHLHNPREPPKLLQHGIRQVEFSIPYPTRIENRCKHHVICWLLCVFSKYMFDGYIDFDDNFY